MELQKQKENIQQSILNVLLVKGDLIYREISYFRLSQLSYQIKIAKALMYQGH